MSNYEVSAPNLVKDQGKGRSEDGRFYAVGEKVDGAELGPNLGALVASGALSKAKQAAKPSDKEGSN